MFEPKTRPSAKTRPKAFPQAKTNTIPPATARPVPFARAGTGTTLKHPSSSQSIKTVKVKSPRAITPDTAAVTPLKPTTPEPTAPIDPATGFTFDNLTSAQFKTARTWYKANAQQYTPTVIRAIQEKLQLPVTGTVDHAFLNGVASWQATFDLALYGGRSTVLANGNQLGGFLPTGAITPEQMAKLFPAGLARPESFARYIKETDRIVQTWNTLDTASKRKQAIEALLKQFSQANGLPAPQFTATPMSASLLGTFTFKTWQLELNASTLRPDMTPEEIRDVLDTLYHETRHAEQNFMALRLMVGMGFTPTQIAARTGMRPVIIAAAARKPISPQSVQGIVANEFYQSSFGAQATSRKDTMANLSLRRSEWEIAKDELRYLESRRQEVVQFQKEATSAAEKAERQQQLKTLDAQLKTARTKLSNAERRYDAAYDAYRAIPGERDAWDAQGALDTIRARSGRR